MYQLKTLVPILPSPDIAQSLRFYSSLGFSQAWLWSDQGTRIHDINATETIIYGGLDLPSELHFNQLSDTHILENTTLRISVDGDIKAFYQHCLELGCVHPNGKLEVKPWGRLEFAVLDPFGICVYFWQDLT
ncbi:MAG: VOC family protein [Deinococcales bacterium]